MDLTAWYQEINRKPSFTLCCGLPGSGKTNAARYAMLRWPRLVLAIDPVFEMRYPPKRGIRYLTEPLDSWQEERPPRDSPAGTLVLIDELADWMDGDPEHAAAVRRLCRLRRPWGLTVVAMTQRPTGVSWAAEMADHLLIGQTDGPLTLKYWRDSKGIEPDDLLSLKVDGEAAEYLWIHR